MISARDTNRRWLLFGLWLAFTVAISWSTFVPLLQHSLANDDASHIVLIPFISAWLLFLDRKRIFNHPSSDFVVGALLLIPGIIFLIRSFHTEPLSSSTYALALVLLWIAGFALAFGREALRLARFSLLFLFLFVPLPDVILGRVVYILQEGSAELSAFFFQFMTVPVLREGFVFHLPRFTIEVAPECSGIRSSIALLVLALLVGHFFLKTFWKQLVFLLAGFAVMFIKNGIRIVTLTLLANYVDPGFLHGDLHREGGVVFFMIGLLLLVPIFWLLQRGESQSEPPAVKLSAPAI